MGFTAYIIPGLSQFYMYAAILYFMYLILSNNNRSDEVLLAAGYITGFEVFNRMTGGSFISYEFAKFSVIGILLVGMFYRGFEKNSWPYILFLIFLLPGIFFSVLNLNYDTNFMNALSFNLSGPICLGISALYCYDRRIPPERLQYILLSILLPIVSTTVYLYFYTPNIRDALSGTQSNFQTSGGFGPNQVATVLGLGMFILFSRLLIIKSRLINIIDLGLLGFMSFRAIVTFSRGGVITAAVCAVIFVVFYFISSSNREKALLLPKISVVLVLLVTTWFISSVVTTGLIDKRYSNQDAAGRLKEDISTGRSELIESELNAFLEHPFTGIGVGKMKEYRLKRTGTEAAVHNELSRLLSEHGIFGIFIFLLLFFTPIFYRITNRSNVYLFSFLIFWLLTINHSSMRIAAPAFIYGLCLLTIVNAKKKTAIHRQ